MPLHLPSGAHCFVDANILYYAYTETPPLSEPCRQFLDRVQADDLVAHTTTRELADAVHKTMIAEVVLRTGRERAGMIGWLKKHPDIIGRLTALPEVVRQLLALKLRALAVDPAMFVEAIAVSAHHLLLTNDAMIVMTMRRHGLVHLVTNDGDFDGVDGLTVWKPR